MARHNEKCCLAVNNWFPKPPCKHGLTRQYDDDENSLFKVEVTLHLFPTIDATNLSVRRLLRIYKRVKSSLPPDGPYRAMSQIIPILYVRQGRDEDAYDFIYDPEDGIPKKDYLVYSPQFFANHQSTLDLGHQVLLTLITIKALRQLKDIRNLSRALGGHIPQEIIDEISKNLVTDSIKSISRFDYLKATGNAVWRQQKIREIEKVLMRLVGQVSRTNEHVWEFMLDTERLSARDTFGQFSSLELSWNITAKARAEMVAIRQYQVWMETPGSHDILRSAMAAEKAAVKARRWFYMPGRLLELRCLESRRIDEQPATWAARGFNNA